MGWLVLKKWTQKGYLSLAIHVRFVLGLVGIYKNKTVLKKWGQKSKPWFWFGSVRIFSLNTKWFWNFVSLLIAYGIAPVTPFMRSILYMPRICFVFMNCPFCLTLINCVCSFFFFWLTLCELEWRKCLCLLCLTLLVWIGMKEMFVLFFFFV